MHISKTVAHCSSLTAVLLSYPFGGEGPQGATGLSVGCQRAAHLSLGMVIAAIQVAGVVEGLGIQEAMAWLKETLQLGELLTGAIALECCHCCVIAGLSQSHILGFVTTGRQILTEVSCNNHWAPSSKKGKINRRIRGTI